jgi:radical SAM superfamily enzyme YgiQ (UPF0313 family)
MIKIFLGDLAYDTVSLSTDANPLNIGYIAAYVKKMFGAQVEIRLFKYINDLEEVLIEQGAPHILGLSNYCWCENISLEIFSIAKKREPETVCVWGGPNFPKTNREQLDFLQSKQQVDCYIPLEGEIGFANVVSSYLAHLGSPAGAYGALTSSSIEGVFVRRSTGAVECGPPVARLRELDQIPSPYLTGLLDGFFDGKLKPRIQTSRGCPFTCSFCVDGSDAVNKVNKFSLERIKQELEYIASHVPSQSEALGISDLNFGMYSRDLEICQYIAKLQAETGYPTKIMTTTGKNSKEKIIKTIEILHSSMNLSMSVQSLDKDVLRNIKRTNISSEKILELAPSIKKVGLRTVAEVILGLPGDSYQSHVNTLRALINGGLDHVQAYTLMLLNGSELDSAEERKKWGFITKFRILPRDFVRLRSGKVVLEIEEVVVASNTLTFEEYIKLRVIALIVLTWSHGVVFDAFQKFIKLKDLDAFDVILGIVEQAKTNQLGFSKLVKDYEAATREELWDSKEELIEFYQPDEQYCRLVEGQEGFNVIQVFHGKIVDENVHEVVMIAGELVRALIEQEELESEAAEQLQDVVNFTLGITKGGLLHGEEDYLSPWEFRFNVLEWMNEVDDLPLRRREDRRRKLVFSRRPDARVRIENEFKTYGLTAQGRAQVIKRVQVSNLWREAKLAS